MHSFKKLFLTISALSFLIAVPLSSTFATQATGTGNNIPTMPLPLPASSVDQCHDHIQDGDETGIDCGGKYCKPCNNGHYNVNVTLPQLPVLQWLNRWNFPANKFQVPNVPKVFIPGFNCEKPQDPSSGDTSSTPSPPTLLFTDLCQNNPDGTITVSYTKADGTKVSYHPVSDCSYDGSINTPQCNMGALTYQNSFCNPGYVCSYGDNDSAAKCVPERGVGQCRPLANGSTTLTVTTSDGHTETFYGNNYCEYRDGSDYVAVAICDPNQNPNHISHEEIKCADGMICLAGSCQPAKQPTCKDNGDGTVSWSNKYGGFGTDITSCEDSKTLVVVSCNGNVEQGSEKSCSSDQICKNGACVTPLPPCPK